MRRVTILFVLLYTFILLYSCNNRTLSNSTTSKLYEKTIQNLKNNNINPIYISEMNNNFEKHIIISDNEHHMFIKNGDNLNYYYNGYHYTLKEGSNQYTKEYYDNATLINEDKKQYIDLIKSLLETVESVKGYKATGRDMPILASPDDYWLEIKLSDTKVKEIFNDEEITTKSAIIVYSNESTLKGFQFNFEGEIEINIYIYIIYPDNRLSDIIAQWKEYFNMS